MKNSKILIFLLAMVMILTVSAVSAADIDDSSDADVLAVDGEGIDEIADVNEDTQSTTGAEVIAAEDGNNFTSLQNLINEEGKTNLTLEKDYTRVSEDSDIEINKDFTIDGQGKYTIDANKLGRIFKVNEGKTLTLKGLFLVNGTADNGGAIYSQGKLNIDACNFINNNATKDGGAVYSTNNVSVKDQSKFNDNVATRYGGAICVIGSGNDIVANVENSIFEENTALQGGAIFHQNAELIVDDSVFNKNNAVGNVGGEWGSGPAILTYLASLEVYNSNFTANRAQYNGGAIYFYNSRVNGIGIIDNCRFENNVADDSYGAIYVTNCKNCIVNFNINNTKFINNTNKATSADFGSAALLFMGNNLNINNTEFTDNKGTKYSAIYYYSSDSDNSNLTIENTNFTNNDASVGTIVNILNGNAKMSNVKFDSNTAASDSVAKAILIYNGAKVEIKDSTFINNGGAEDNAIYNNGTLKLENNNISNKIGGEGELIKPGSNVTINPITNVSYGNPVVVYYTIENRSSNVTVSICYYNKPGQPNVEDVNYTIDDEKITIYDLFADEYLIIIFNNEDNNYLGNSSYAVFNVTKATPVFDVKAYVNEFGMIVVNVTTNKDATGNVTFKIDDKAVPIAIENGSAIFDEISVYAKGIHNITVAYDGDDNYEKASHNITVEITKDVPVIEIESIKVDDYGAIVVKANITKGATGDVTFDFYNLDTGKNLTGVVIPIGENGTIEYSEMSSFEKGHWNVQIGYAGDANYYAQAENTQDEVNVTKSTTSLDIEISTIEKNITVKVTANDTNVSGQVNITVFDLDGKAVANVTKDMVNGIVEYTFTGIEFGDYKVWAEFLGSDDFYQTYAEDMANVRATVEMNLNVTVNNYGNAVVVANLTKDATGTVNFIIMNSSADIVANLTANIKNGTANNFTSATLANGYYTVEAIYSGDDKYGSAYAFGNVAITKEYINVTSKVSIMDGSNQATITINFPANATGNITIFYPSGANETRAINSTVVVDEIFDNGHQFIFVNYDGDDNYYGFYAYYIDFFVKTSSFISAKDVSVVYKNTGNVTVTLTNNDDGKGNVPIAGAEVVITLNGKTYKGKTDANGVATISIPANLVPKVYTAKVTYAGNATCVGDYNDFNFTVKKATPKVIAKKKTFKKSKKVKKYSITLKDNKGKAIKKAKVSIKVGKKTFKAKTTAKGKAVFKLKKLTKKAKYTAKITYKGNKYFNKVTKKVKITIK